MRRAASWSWKALLVLAIGAYQYLVHSAVINPHTARGYLVLIFLPLLALVCWVVTRFRNKPLWLGVLLLSGILAYLLEHREHVGLVALTGVSHTAAYLFLLWYFGHTLAGGREPLITRFARRAHGTLPPVMEAYTRGLTLIWCVFFGAQLLASALLYLFASLNAWSVFINLLNFPLLLAMFIGEALYRTARHPEHPPVSIEQAVRAFINDTSVSKSTGAR